MYIYIYSQIQNFPDFTSFFSKTSQFSQDGRPGLWAHLHDACNPHHKEKLGLALGRLAAQEILQQRLETSEKASGSTKKFPLSLASLLSFTSSAECSAYSSV